MIYFGGKQRVFGILQNFKLGNFGFITSHQIPGTSTGCRQAASC